MKSWKTTFISLVAVSVALSPVPLSAGDKCEEGKCLPEEKARKCLEDHYSDEKMKAQQEDCVELEGRMNEMAGIVNENRRILNKKNRTIEKLDREIAKKEQVNVFRTIFEVAGGIAIFGLGYWAGTKIE